MIIPATAPRAPLRANENRIIRFTEMPTRAAALRSTAVARITFPIIVLLKKYRRASITRTVMPKTHICCGNIVAPPGRWIGVCPEKAGTPTLSVPQISWDVPRRVPDIPIVKKIRIMISFDRAYRKGPLSIKAPTRVTPTVDKKKDIISGILKRTTRVYMNIPPRDMNSHWAKLTIPVALWMMLKPIATRA